MAAFARLILQVGKLVLIAAVEEPRLVAGGGTSVSSITFPIAGTYLGYVLGNLTSGIASANAHNVAMSCEKTAADGGGNFAYGDQITGAALVLQNGDAAGQTYGANFLFVLRVK